MFLHVRIPTYAHRHRSKRIRARGLADALKSQDHTRFKPRIHPSSTHIFYQPVDPGQQDPDKKEESIDRPTRQQAST
ncbi:hypothetical protein BM1_07948 [Bipolaris maydis]|nr:hypothetical protein BM1_07948 [Bipolaris maydis]